MAFFCSLSIRVSELKILSICELIDSHDPVHRWLFRGMCYGFSPGESGGGRGVGTGGEERERVKVQKCSATCPRKPGRPCQALAHKRKTSRRKSSLLFFCLTFQLIDSTLIHFVCIFLYYHFRLWISLSSLPFSFLFLPPLLFYSLLYQFFCLEGESDTLGRLPYPQCFLWQRGSCWVRHVCFPFYTILSLAIWAH